jgi:hypothetical protein
MRYIIARMVIALALFVPSVSWADLITSYPAAGIDDGTGLYPCDQSGVTKKCPIQANVYPATRYASLDAAVTAISSTVATLTISTTLPVVDNVTVPSTSV